LALLAIFFGASPADAQPVDYTDLLARPRANPTQRIHYGDAPDQFADLWMPAGNAMHHVVVMIHGGCWRADLPGFELMAYAAEDLRQRGIAVWNIEYRRIGEPGGGYPGSFEDVGNAIDWLRKIAPANKLDIATVVVVGHSSGGHLALWAAARQRLAKTSPLYRDNALPMKGVVSLAGIADLDAYRVYGPPVCGGPGVIDSLVGRASRGPWDIFTDTSPADMVPLGVPQAIISGARDPIVPPPFGKGYAAKAAAAGDRVQENTIGDAGHFELIDPNSRAFADVRAAIIRFWD